MFARAVRLSFLTLLGALLLAGPAQAAYATGDYAANVRHRFVTVEERGGHPALRVTALTHERYRHHDIAWECRTLSTGSPPLLIGDAFASDDAWLGDTTWLRVLPGADYCQVQIALRRVRHVRHRGWTETITRVDKRRQTLAVTDEGRAYIARVRGAYRLFLSVLLVSGTYDRRQGRFLTPAELFAKYPKLADAGYAPLSGPESTPAKGKHGVWTDGAKRFRVTEVTRDGVVLYYDSDAGTKALSTNAQDEINEATRSDGWWYDGGYWTSSSSSSASRR